MRLEHTFALASRWLMTTQAPVNILLFGRRL